MLSTRKWEKILYLLISYVTNNLTSVDKTQFRSPHPLTPDSKPERGNRTALKYPIISNLSE